MTTSPAPCRAKDPSTCPYHGAEMRLGLAIATRDWDAYSKAQADLEAAKKDRATGAPATKRNVKSFTPKQAEPLVSVAQMSPLERQDYLLRQAKNRAVSTSNLPVGDFPDSISHEGEVYVKADGAYKDLVDMPYSMLIQTNRPLSDEDTLHANGLLGYAWRETLAGESLDWVKPASDSSYTVFADMTKSPRSNVYEQMSALEEKFTTYVKEGSPVRKRVNNTRLIEGFKPESGEDMKAVIYYELELKVHHGRI